MLSLGCLSWVALDPTAVVQQDPELAEAVASKQMGGCVATRPKGASFGELALINNKPRAATVFALQRCFFMTVNKKAYQSVIGVREDKSMPRVRICQSVWDAPQICVS